MHEPLKKVYDAHGPTIFEYSTTEVTLPSCLSVPSEHVASQSKWQSANLCTSQSKPRPPPPPPHPGTCGTLVRLYHHIGSSLSPQYVGDSRVFLLLS